MAPEGLRQEPEHAVNGERHLKDRQLLPEVRADVAAAGKSDAELRDLVWIQTR